MKKIVMGLALLVNATGYGVFYLNDDMLPRGSYIGMRDESGTCLQCTYDDNTGWLKCQCQKNDQSYMDTSINIKVLEQIYPELRPYYYDIANDNGTLKAVLPDGRMYQFIEGDRPKQIK